MSPTSPRQPGLGAAGGARQQAATTPMPFKLHRESHLIHKQGASASTSPPSSSSTNSSVSSSPGAGTTGSQQRPAPRPKQQQQPVIIYTTSPKVIRTSPRDFMSIVQKLTGLDSAAAAGSAVTGGAAQDESSSSSTESCANANVNSHAGAAPAPPLGHYMADPPQLMPPPASMDHAHFMPDIPLFPPAGASEHQQHLLCASRGGLYGHFQPTMVDGAANMHDPAGAVYSPSMVEAMRAPFPDYQLT